MCSFARIGVVPALSVPLMRQNHVYAPYGFQPSRNGALGFNGESADRLTGHYPLGNGYRAYNPVLMRFNIPDSLSPFARGGLNAYGYCQGEPVNSLDPSGHWLVKVLGSMVNRMPTSGRAVVAGVADKVPKTYSQFVGGHGTSAKYAEAMKLSGPKPGFSKSGRQRLGDAFYTTADPLQYQAYAKDAEGPGVVLGVFLEDGVSLVPGIGYAMDKANRIAIYPLVYEHIKIKDMPAPQVKAIELRQAASLWLKKPAPGA
jgi:RHS repeat-associated protein